MSRSTLILVIAGLGCAHAAARPISRMAAASAQAEVGRRFIEQLGRRDFAAAAAPFTEKMRAVFPPDKLAESWDWGLKKWGQLQAVEGARAEPYMGGWAVIVVCRFDNGVHTIYVSLDADNRIRGDWFNASAVVGRLFIERLAAGDDDGADALTDQRMHDVAPPRALGDLWSQLEAQFGPFKRVVSSKLGLGASVVVAFAKSTVTFSVAVDGHGQVGGFHIMGTQPASATAQAEPDLQTEPQLDFDRQAAP